MSAIATLSTGLAQTDTTQATQIVRGTILLAGTPAATGDILALNLYGVQSNYPPLRVFVYETPVAGAATAGFEYVYATGTDPSNGRLLVLGGAAASPGGQVQITAAYPGNLVTQSAAGGLSFEAVFALGN